MGDVSILGKVKVGLGLLFGGTDLSFVILDAMGAPCPISDVALP